MVLNAKSFEAAIVRHCSPTLAGIKPGCLFNVPGTFAADLNEEPAVQLTQWKAAKELCRKLDVLIAKTNEKLRGTGVCVRAIAHRHCGALIYVWNPALLNASLNDPRVTARLTEWGYGVDSETGMKLPSPTFDLNMSIAHLGERLEDCHRKNPEASFPHEVGFFLGYPYEDVMGFIEHNGQDYLCCGCWKVYSDQQAAEAAFEQYKRCTHTYEAMLAHGVALADLATHKVAA